MEAYDAFSLSPVNVVARVCQPSEFRVENFQRDCHGCFGDFKRDVGAVAWLAQIGDLRLIAVGERVVKILLG